MDADPVLVLNLVLAVLAVAMSAKLAFRLRRDVIGSAWKSSVLVAVLYLVLKGGQVAGSVPTEVALSLLGVSACASVYFHQKVLAGVGSVDRSV